MVSIGRNASDMTSNANHGTIYGATQLQIGMDEVIEHFYLMVQMTMCKQHTVLQFQLRTFHILFGQSRPRLLRFMGAQLLFEIMEEGLTFINSPIIHGLLDWKRWMGRN